MSTITETIDETFSRAKRALSIIGIASDKKYAEDLREFLAFDDDRKALISYHGFIAEIEAICGCVERYEIEHQRQAQISQHIGTVDERREFTGRISFTKTFPPKDETHDEWTITILADDDGNVIVYHNHINVPNETPKPEIEDEFEPWKKTRPAVKGERVTFLAKVKSHGEYKGVKQTNVQRATKARLA